MSIQPDNPFAEEVNPCAGKVDVPVVVSAEPLREAQPLVDLLQLLRHGASVVGLVQMRKETLRSRMGQDEVHAPMGMATSAGCSGCSTGDPRRIDATLRVVGEYEAASRILR